MYILVSMGSVYSIFLFALLQLEFDILQYIVIERLAQGGREKLKDDGLNLSDWLQCLASFWGHLYVLTPELYILHFHTLCLSFLSNRIIMFLLLCKHAITADELFFEPIHFNRCKKHHSVELRSLFQYLVNQLKKDTGIELVVLEVYYWLLSSFPLLPWNCMCLKSNMITPAGTHSANGKCAIH